MSEPTYPCNTCATEHTWVEAHALGMVCARCRQHTGNNNQGHNWTFCAVTGGMRTPHFCCPGDCELEATP